MLHINNFDIYIFDCDGVILDSNNLKIDAMINSLNRISNSENEINKCITYFRNNFGKSRYHHIRYFVEQILSIKKIDKDIVYDDILFSYSEQCKKLYLSAEITEGFIDFVNTIKGKKYVASGSDQNELIEVFKLRGLDKYFENIYGSPKRKNEIVSEILEVNKSKNAVMFGDSISDYEASLQNNINFIGILKYSNVKNKLLSIESGEYIQIIEKWSKIN